jgi:hypothetical protein
MTADEDYAAVIQLIERGQVECEPDSLNDQAVYFVPDEFDPDPSVWDPILAAMKTLNAQCLLLLLAQGEVCFKIDTADGCPTVRWRRR